MNGGKAQLGRVAVGMVAAVAMAVGATACGSDAGGSDGSDAQEQRAKNEQQIKATYAELVRAFYAPDPKAGCATMTPEAQKAFANGTGTDKKLTCVQRMKSFDPKQLSKNKPFVVKIAFKGNNAVASVKTKRSNIYKVPFTKVDGRWMISGGV